MTHGSVCDKMEGGLWGCIVIFSAFFIQVLAFGTSQTIGVYNVEFLRYFDDGATAVSLVGAINLGVFLGAGPISSMLMSRWSHRQVALLGAALSSLGLLCMPFAPNLPYMYLFYGALTGLGNCLAYVPSHVLSGLYFSKHRSLATGIATSGSGFGASVFPIVFYHLIEYYGWRGSLLILAGLNLHLVLFAALLRPVPKHLVEKLAEEEEKQIACQGDREGELDGLYSEELDSKGIVRLDSGNNVIADIDIRVGAEHEKWQNEDLIGTEHDKTVPILKTDVTVPLKTKSSRKSGMILKFQKHIISFLTFDFFIYWISNILWDAGLGILLLFLPEYMISVGLAKHDASIAYSLVGAGSCVGCVIGGLLGNIKCFDRIILYIIGNLGAGVASVMIVWPATHCLLGQAVLGLTYGFFFGIILGLLVVVTSDLIGVEALGDGFGYIMLADGIGIFGGPPIAGALLDLHGTLEPVLYLSAAFTAFGGIIMCVVPIRRRWCVTTRHTRRKQMKTAIRSFGERSLTLSKPETRKRCIKPM